MTNFHRSRRPRAVARRSRRSAAGVDAPRARRPALPGAAQRRSRTCSPRRRTAAAPDRAAPRPLPPGPGCDRHRPAGPASAHERRGDRDRRRRRAQTRSTWHRPRLVGERGPDRARADRPATFVANALRYGEQPVGRQRPAQRQPPTAARSRPRPRRRRRVSRISSSASRAASSRRTGRRHRLGLAIAPRLQRVRTTATCSTRQPPTRAPASSWIAPAELVPLLGAQRGPDARPASASAGRDDHGRRRSRAL